MIKIYYEKMENYERKEKNDKRINEKENSEKN
jgi:hypothetical protein